MRSSANWMPLSKLPPSLRPLAKNSSSVLVSDLVAGRRYASRAILDRILVAHAVSSDAALGWQMKIWWRDWVSGTVRLKPDTTVAGATVAGVLYGPPICTTATWRTPCRPDRP